MLKGDPGLLLAWFWMVEIRTPKLAPAGIDAVAMPLMVTVYPEAVHEVGVD